MSRLEAASALRDCQALEIEVLPFGPFADRVWSLRPDLSSHDAWYVAIAERFPADWATLDRRLA